MSFRQKDPNAAVPYTHFDHFYISIPYYVKYGELTKILDDMYKDKELNLEHPEVTNIT